MLIPLTPLTFIHYTPHTLIKSQFLFLKQLLTMRKRNRKISSYSHDDVLAEQNSEAEMAEGLQLKETVFIYAQREENMECSRETS